MKDCIFCYNNVKDRIIEENEYAFAIRDNYPVTNLHTLVIPKRHVFDFFNLEEKEIICCDSLLLLMKNSIIQEDNTVSGFNVGVNIGESAGQTIMHCHIHLIPRRRGDVENPRGGVRHVIPWKGDYNV